MQNTEAPTREIFTERASALARQEIDAILQEPHERVPIETVPLLRTFAVGVRRDNVLGEGIYNNVICVPNAFPEKDEEDRLSEPVNYAVTYNGAESRKRNPVALTISTQAERKVIVRDSVFGSDLASRIYNAREIENACKENSVSIHTGVLTPASARTLNLVPELAPSVLIMDVVTPGSKAASTKATSHIVNAFWSESQVPFIIAMLRALSLALSEREAHKALHAMPSEFYRLWQLHKASDPALQSSIDAFNSATANVRSNASALSKETYQQLSAIATDSLREEFGNLLDIYDNDCQDAPLPVNNMPKKSRKKAVRA